MIVHIENGGFNYLPLETRVSMAKALWGRAPYCAWCTIPIRGQNPSKGEELRPRISLYWSVWFSKHKIFILVNRTTLFPPYSYNLRQKPQTTLADKNLEKHWKILPRFLFPSLLQCFCNHETLRCNHISTLQREREVHGCFKDFWRGL